MKNEYLTLNQLRTLKLNEHKRKWNGPYQGKDTPAWTLLMTSKKKAHEVYKAAMLGLSADFDRNCKEDGIGRTAALVLYQESKKPIEASYEKAVLEARRVFNMRGKKK